MIDGLKVQYQAVEDQGEVPNMDDLEGTYIKKLSLQLGKLIQLKVKTHQGEQFPVMPAERRI